jgi:serine/threonine-protein kinase RsbW
MSEERWNWWTDQWIASEHGEGRRVQEEVLEQLERHLWTEHEVFGIRLAMEEALVNAIKHGNRLDAAKRVRVACKVSPERIWIEITDEGPGFKPEDVPDPTDPDRLECTSGRGLMLMRSFMTFVEFNEIGNRVTMEKARQPKED